MSCRWPGLALAVAAVLCPVVAAATVPVYPDLAALERGVDALYCTEYGRAQRELADVSRRFPAHPAGPFFGSLVDFATLYEGADLDPRREERFIEALELTIERAEPLRDADATRAVGEFYYGSAHGFWARHLGMQGKWWGAYRHGKKARDSLEKALELDPGLVDANLGLGVYHVYADILPGVVKAFDFLLRIRGDRERGLREIHRARRSGVLTRIEATFYLATVATEFDRQYDRGLEYARELTHRYPANATFRSMEARSLMGLGEYAHAERRLASLYFDDLWQRPGHATRQSAYDLGRLLIRGGRERQGRELLVHHFREADDPFTWFLPWAKYYVGLASDVLGERDVAEDWYRRAIAMGDRTGSESRAKQRLKRAMTPVERRYARARGQARLRSSAAVAMQAAYAAGTGDGGERLRDDKARGEALWTAGLAALRAEDAAFAQRSFRAALDEELSEALHGYAVLGLAAATACAGDTAGAIAIYEELLADGERSRFHGRARGALGALRSAPRLAAADAPGPGWRYVELEYDCTGLEWLLAPAVTVDPTTRAGGNVTLHGAFGKFAGGIWVPPEGLRYRLRLPGCPPRLDPTHPRVAVDVSAVDSFLPGIGVELPR